ncbi:hypothetical protein ANN_19530 [Periplaneta americana]|uniref:Uncharacterized protein n=1 Tax=Periplaneta americana TaxID=6978 RepID=A0ABQ8SAG2_PERAM|nr:hypothetical protein ANN_19530 [Periplaneta americana]
MAGLCGGGNEPLDSLKGICKNMPNLESGHKVKNTGEGEFDSVLWIGLRRSSMVTALENKNSFPAEVRQMLKELHTYRTSEDVRVTRGNDDEADEEQLQLEEEEEEGEEEEKEEGR